MNIIKKQSLSSLITIGVAIFSLVAVIIYGVNGNMDGQFNGLNESSVIVLSVLSIIFSAAIVVLSNLSFEGNTKKIVDFAITLLKIVLVVMLILSFMLFLYSRAEGFAFIFGSDDNAQDAAQTDANMATASVAICGLVFYFIAWLASLVAVFFSPRKEEKN